MIQSAEEFAKLRTSRLAEEQERASRDEAPLEVWLNVVARFPDLREWVAINKTVPVEVLTKLATDPDSKVRCAVAEKRKLTPALRRLLSTDQSATVRARIAYNAKCEVEILQALAVDPELIVREAAMKRLLERGRVA